MKEMEVHCASSFFIFSLNVDVFQKVAVCNLFSSSLVSVIPSHSSITCILDNSQIYNSNPAFPFVFQFPAQHISI